MKSDIKLGVIDSMICAISPERGLKRLAARRVLHQFRYDGAIADSRRGTAPQNMSPNSFDVQRDRLQLMREAEDMERNFAPAKMLNRKFASYVTPNSYHAQTGDTGLDKEIEEYLIEDAFLNCDITRRYDFYRMLEFAVLGCNRGGDYGFAFQRPGSHPDMSEDELVQLPFRIQAIEPDRIGGIYQNVVSNDYVSGLNIGEHGQIDSFRVFHRSMTTNTYDNPIDVPAADFVHLTDPMRIDQYRGVSILATAIQNLRDLYEMIDFVKGKAKLASALTVFTNSNGALAGSSAMDAYATNLFPGDATGLQQDIQFGQINHLAAGTDIKFPASSSPSSEEQWLMTQLLKFVAMSYDLPYSFALDASALGGVSSRLESEMAKATFERFQLVLAPHANRIKNAMLFDATAKGIFPASKLSIIHRGRWGYRPHPQPDLGREASAAVNLYQNGLLDPMKHWVDNGQDPESVATSMARWALIKKATAEKSGLEIFDIFGSGPTTPTATSESTSIAEEPTKEFSRKEYRESDKSIDAKIEEERDNVEFGTDWVADIREGIADLANGENPEALQRLRVELDKANAYLAQHQDALDKLQDRRQRRDKEKPQKPVADRESKETRSRKRDERHALTEALKASGKGDREAYAIAYAIIEKGQFDKSKLPADILEKYFSSKSFKSNVPFDESKHKRADDGKFGPGGNKPSSGRSQRASIGNLVVATREGSGKESKITIEGKPAPDFIKPGMIPPAYSYNIRLATDRNSDVWAISEDEKGNTKRVYNPEFEKRNAAIKWARTNEGVGKIDSIRSQIHKDRNQGKNKEEADAAWLMSQQATRPGSEEDTKGTKVLWSKPVTTKNFTLTPQPKGPPKVSIKVGDSNIQIRDEGARSEIAARIERGLPMGDAGYWLKSHGATTLEGRHVVKNSDGSASLQFMGKEGVWHDHKVTDPKLSEMLLGRKDAAGDTEKLFKTDYANVAKYIGTLGGGGFSPKDMRTIRANELATKLIGGTINVNGEDDRKAIIKDIAIKVSRVLGNRPQQALESYINPIIFDVIKLKKSA